MARARAGREPGAGLRRTLARVAGLLGLGAGAPHLRTGRRGERLAARHLRRQGYRVLHRNARLRAGEADILCVDPDGRTLVLVEVKTRRPRASGRGASIPPEAAVGHDKAGRLRHTLAEARSRLGWTDRPARIDIVAIEFREGGRRDPPVLRHVRAAVGGR